MPPESNPKKYDLEERTYLFAKRVRVFCRALPRNLANAEDAKQLVRSSGSIAANYIEANEALGKKDFVMKVKICRKEAKESVLWLRLLELGPTQIKEQEELRQEAGELTNIFGAIVRKCE